jgi:hypothetical protein
MNVKPAVHTSPKPSKSVMDMNQQNILEYIEYLNHRLSWLLLKKEAD